MDDPVCEPSSWRGTGKHPTGRASPAFVALRVLRVQPGVVELVPKQHFRGQFCVGLRLPLFVTADAPFHAAVRRGA